MLPNEKDNTMNLRINRNPGKFEGELVISEYVYELSLEGCDEEFNSADIWVGLLCGSIQVSATDRLEMEMNADELFYLDRVVKGAIIEELSNGFVSVTYYEDSELLESDWQILLTEAIIDEDDI